MFIELLKKLQKSINLRVEEYGAQYTTIGVFGVINYPVFYLVWRYVFPQGYSSFFLRASATVLCAALLFHKYWPKRFQYYLPVFWYFTLLYCLPFFFTFLFFQNHGSSVSAFSLIPISVLLMLLTDWLSGIMLLFLGTFLGALMSYLCLGEFQLRPDFDYVGFLTNYIFSALIGFVFARNHQRQEKEKIQTMRSIGTSIAHEIRTPLLAIRAGATGVRTLLHQAVENYRAASANNPTAPEVDEARLENLFNVIRSIDSEAYAANTVINMLLMKVTNSETISLRQERCSILKIIETSLERFPFQSDNQKTLIFYDKKNDFIFTGHELLMTHVFFNLLKNALYYVGAAGKGTISIAITPGEKINKLTFKDTGKGIAKKNLPYIFDKFFSKTHNGTGLGLWFCKMVLKSYGGDIVCRSVENEFTEFLLSFPVKV